MNAAPRVEEPPDGVTDATLWRYAHEATQRHHQSIEDGMCGFCGTSWPCQPYQLAKRADEVSRAPRSQWHRAHTMHADLASIGGRVWTPALAGAAR